jgi:thiol-disulfide isomerase/thioredoxin
MLAGCDRAAEAPAQPVEAGGPSGTTIGLMTRQFAGTPIPDLQVRDPAGRVLDLGQQDGAVLINLWATWCVPCVREMPQLDALAGALEGEVRVITVSQDVRGAEVVTPFFARSGLKRLEPWLDPDTALSAQFTPEGALPLTILFDARGREVLRVVGGYDWGSPEAAKLVRDALKPA